MTENPGVTPGNTTSVPNVPPTGTDPANTPDNPPTTGSPADATPTEHAPTHDGGVAFEEKRQEELAEARQVHAERGSEPDAQQRLTADHEGTGAGDEQPQQGNLEGAPDGTDNA